MSDTSKLERGVRIPTKAKKMLIEYRVLGAIEGNVGRNPCSFSISKIVAIKIKLLIVVATN
jgi:hypothetical protein